MLTTQEKLALLQELWEAGGPRGIRKSLPGPMAASGTTKGAKNMEIRTIVVPRGLGSKIFDEQVNDALKKGFQLTRRDIVPGFVVGSTTLEPAYYAELVKPDEPPQKDGVMNVLDALNVVREFCDDHQCDDKCLLNEFCERHLAESEGPTDWVLPGEGSKE